MAGKKVRKVVSLYCGKVTHRKTERREQRKGRSDWWSASCGTIVCGGLVINSEMTVYCVLEMQKVFV